MTFGGQTFTNQGLLGVGRLPSNLKDRFGETFGSFSAFTFDLRTVQASGGSFTGTLYAQPDRGYNAVGTTDYTARFNVITFSFTPAPTGSAQQNQVRLTLADTVLYKEANGTVLTSLDPPANGSGIRAGFPPLPQGTNGKIALDPEGIVRLRDGSFYVSDEYGPYIYRFSSTGVLLSAIRPPEAIVGQRNGGDSFASNNPGPGASAPVPADPVTGRQNNQGLEGLTLAPDGRKLFALLQSATRQDGGTGGTSAVRHNTRLLAYDITGATPVLTGEYVFQLPTFVQGGTRVAAQSEALALNNNQFLVLVRDSAGHGLALSTSVFRSIYLYDISAATNIANTAFDTAGTPIAPGGTLAAGIVPATRAELININDPVQLAKFGLHNGLPDDNNNLSEKWEGLAIVPALDAAAPNDVYLFVGNDNDFITTDGFQAGTGYNAGIDNDTMILVYRLTLPTYVDPLAMESAALTGVPLVQTLHGHTLGVSRIATRDLGGHLAALRLGRAGPAGLSAFATGDWAGFDDDARSGYTGYAADGWAAAGGVQYLLGDHLLLGLAASRLETAADVNGDLGEIEAEGTGLSGFLSVNAGSFYLDGSFTHHDLEYDLARRTAAYGLTATGSAEGSSKVVRGQAGWRRRLGGFLLTAEGGIEHIAARVSSFTESGALHVNLAVPALAPTSTRWHGGLQVAREFSLGRWQLTPYLAGQYIRENDAESRAFTLVLADRTAVSGSSVTAGTAVGESGFWQGRAGLAGALSDRLWFNLEGATILNSDYGSQDSLRVALNYHF